MERRCSTINLTGVWKTLKATVPHVVRGGRGGSVVITSSIATQIAHENTAHYTASKHGLVGLMRVMAKELAPAEHPRQFLAPDDGRHRHGPERHHLPIVPPRPRESDA